ncbi:tellurite resistance TerB family protein [Crocosphaera sp.]|uniref:tellurite resistance TerB family protein n=1 Tax=Crocosphaera sp. TaxID=2729996 RepID=UPI003F1F4754|nr:tellurite resistance TerB family protein [Crocosphaera sp.]
MSNIIESIKGIITKRQNKVRQKQFLEAVMGVCALLAVADGAVDFAELMARDYILDNVEQLQVFDANEAAEIFRLKTEALQNNYQQEKTAIIKLVSPYCEDRELSNLLLKISLIIAKADTKLTSSEQEIINELKQILAIDA